MILLFGLPRSGTTWVGKIFDSHPETLYRHEPDSWVRINTPLVPSLNDLSQYITVLSDYSKRVAHLRGLKVSGKLPLFPKTYQSTFNYHVRQLILLGIKFGAKYSKGLENVHIPDMIRSDEAVRVVWKSIESVGRLGLLAQAVDGVKGILLLRHPCGFIASVLRGEQSGHFTSSTPASEDYGVLEQLLQTPQAEKRGLSLEGFRNMQPVERLAWRWVLWNEKAMEDIREMPNCMVVRYEDICADPIAQSKCMFGFCDLDWQDQTERFLSASTHTNNDSYYSVFKDSSEAASKWRKQLNSEDIDRISEIIADSLPGNQYVS